MFNSLRLFFASNRHAKPGRNSIIIVMLPASTDDDFTTRDVYHPPMLLTENLADVTHRYTVADCDLNGYRIMHGGRMLTLCDEISYLAARKHADGDCLTRAVHRAQFHRSVSTGEHIYIRAKVGLTGNSSLWVAVTIDTEKDSLLIMDAVFVFVAIDADRHSKTVPEFVPCSPAEQQLHRQLSTLRAQLAGTV